jgi:hypothetical protein
MAEMVGNSALSPLLLLSASRAEFTALLLRREPTPADLALRTLLAGFLTAVPLLCVNMWYLLRVTQYGLAPAGWLSLMKGLVLVLRMLFQAYRTALPAADKHQRSAMPISEPSVALASDAAVPTTIEMTEVFGSDDLSDSASRGGARVAEGGPRQSARETDDTLILAPDVQSSSLP